MLVRKRASAGTISRSSTSSSLLQRESRLLAHSRDGGRLGWRPVIGVVLPPLWHQGHKGNAPDCRGGQLPQDRGRGGRTVGRPGVVGASAMATGVVVGSAAPLHFSPRDLAAPLGAAHQEMAGAVRTNTATGIT
jgi:hypothetical protein